MHLDTECNILNYSDKLHIPYTTCVTASLTENRPQQTTSPRTHRITFSRMICMTHGRKHKPHLYTPTQQIHSFARTQTHKRRRTSSSSHVHRYLLSNSILSSRSVQISDHTCSKCVAIHANVLSRSGVSNVLFC